MMNASNAITLPAVMPPDPVRQHDARVARGAPTIIEVELVDEYASSDQASRVGRNTADSRGSDCAVATRSPRTRARDTGTTSLGFAAQRIAQEELSEGLYFENFRPAIAAYAAADSNFATVRRPPLSSIVVWA